MKTKSSDSKIWNRGDSCISNPSSVQYRAQTGINSSLPNDIKNSIYYDRFISFLRDCDVEDPLACELDVEKFGECTCRIISVLEQNIFTKTTTERRIHCIDHLIKSLNTNDADDEIINCSILLVKSLLSSKLDACVLSIANIMKEIISVLKRQSKNVKVLVPLLETSAIMLSSSNETSRSLFCHFTLDILKMISHTDEIVRRTVLIIANNINISKPIPSNDFYNFIVKKMRSTNEVPILISIFNLLSLYSKMSDDCAILKFFLGELMIASSTQRDNYILALSASIKEFQKFKSFLSEVYSCFSSYDTSELHPDVVRSIISLLEFVANQIPINSANLLGFLNILKVNIKSYEPQLPEYCLGRFKGVLDTSASHLLAIQSPLLHQIIVPLMQELVDHISDCDPLIVSSAIIILLDRLDFSNFEEKDQIVLQSTINKLVAGRGECCLQTKFLTPYDKVLVKIVEFIGVNLFLSLVQIDFANAQNILDFRWIFQIIERARTGHAYGDFLTLFNASSLLFARAVSLRTWSVTPTPTTIDMMNVYRLIIKAISRYTLHTTTDELKEVFTVFYRMHEHDHFVRPYIMKFLQNPHSREFMKAMHPSDWVFLLTHRFYHNPKDSTTVNLIRNSIDALLNHCEHEEVQQVIYQLEDSKLISIFSHEPKHSNFIYKLYAYVTIDFALNKLDNLLSINDCENLEKSRINELNEMLNAINQRKCTCCSISPAKNLEIAQKLKNVIDNQINNFDFKHSSALLRCINYLLPYLDGSQIEKYLKYGFSCYFNPTSKVVVRARQVFSKILDFTRNGGYKNWIKQLENVYLKDPLLRYGGLEFLRMCLKRYIEHLNSDDGSLLLSLLLEALENCDRRIFGTVLKIIYILRKFLLNSESTFYDILNKLLTHFRFVNRRSFRSQITLLLRKLPINLTQINYTLIDSQQKMALLRRLVKIALNKPQTNVVKTISHGNNILIANDSDQELSKTDCQSMDEQYYEFPEDDLGRMIVTSVDDNNSDDLFGSDSDSDDQSSCQQEVEPTPNTAVFGAQYRALSAGGDRRLRNEPEPYAFIPLDRRDLNLSKSERAKKFRGIIKSKKS